MGACISKTESFAVHELKDVILPILRDELVPVIIEDVKKHLNLEDKN